MAILIKIDVVEIEIIFVAQKGVRVRLSIWISPVIFLIRRKKNPPTQGGLFLLGDITTILNLILKSCHIIIALLHNKF